MNGNYIVIGTVSGQTFTPLAAVKSQDIQNGSSPAENRLFRQIIDIVSRIRKYGRFSFPEEPFGT